MSRKILFLGLFFLTAVALRAASGTNVVFSWTLSTNWLGGEDVLTGLDVRALTTNWLRTGLMGTTNLRTFYVLTNNMPYQRSNSFTRRMTGVESARVFWK